MRGKALRLAIEHDGFAVCRGVLLRQALQLLRDECGRLLQKGAGLRNALEESPLFRKTADGLLLELAQSVLGAEARPVKGTVFAKSPSSNWKVPWHQDLTIAVATRHDAPGFGPWSVKDGVPHVEPPATVLEAVLAIRLHLDDTPVGNGELQVIPRSHLSGKLTSQGIRDARREQEVVSCLLNSGDAMLMRPLLLHASSKSSGLRQRRVLHVEYSSARLPWGLQWATSPA